MTTPETDLTEPSFIKSDELDHRFLMGEVQITFIGEGQPFLLVFNNAGEEPTVTVGVAIWPQTMEFLHDEMHAQMSSLDNRSEIAPKPPLLFHFARGLERVSDALGDAALKLGNVAEERRKRLSEPSEL